MTFPAWTAACFLIRDAQMPGEHITLFEHLPLAGGSCDGIYDATKGFIMRGGREMDNQIADGKSVLGLMAIDYKKPVRVISEDVKFMKQLDRWAG